jgi:glycosyltransferase involved in cell wall biosynthesis
MDTNNPLITVVTVVYNGEESIENTILSIINQTYKNIEYIIIDGGSIDGTIDIIKKYEEKITFWSSEPDKGIYDAKNKSIEKATGDWINFMNVGDTFVSNDTVKQISNFLKDDLNIVYGDCLIKYNDQSDSIYKKSNNFDKIIYHIPFCHQSVFVKTSLMKEFKFELTYSCTGDYNFFFNVYKCRKNNALRVPIPVSLYDMHGVSNSLTALKEYYQISLRHASNKLIPLYHYIRLSFATFKIKVKGILPKKMAETYIAFQRKHNR